MKFLKTFILFVLVIVFSGTVYYYTVIKEQQQKEELEKKKKIVYLQKDQINYFEIVNKEQRFVFQKNSNAWSIQEPVLDLADNNRINEILTKFTEDKLISVAKEGSDIKWLEFGLDQTQMQVILKNNIGESQKIILSSMKNFEGNYYARVDNENKILIVNSLWFNIINEKLVFFREKQLYRGLTKDIVKINIKSLSDKFNLVKIDKGWQASGHEGMALDQAKVNQIINSVSTTTIQDYIFEGEPSEIEKKEKGFFKDYCMVEFETATDKWSVTVSLNDKDKVLYALTEKPTYLVKLDLSKWELFGNINLDSLRDRKTIMAFDINAVETIFLKQGKKQYEFLKDKQSWKLKSLINSDLNDYDFNPKFVTTMLDKIHNFEMSHFLTDKEAQDFQGQDMIILKTASDQLLYQFNWGPLVKKKVNGLESEYYLARTQASDAIFGFDKKFIDELPLEQIITSKK